MTTDAAPALQTIRTDTVADVERVSAQLLLYRSRLVGLASDVEVGGTLSIKRIGATTVAQAKFGVDLAIECGELAAYHVNLPVKGTLVSRYAGSRVVATSRCAAVYGPEGETVVERWPADCRLMFMRIEREAVEHEMSRLLGRAVSRPLSLAPAIDLRAGAGQSLRHVISMLRAELRAPHGASDHSLAAATLSRWVVTVLLLAAERRYRGELARPRRAPVPAIVRRAVDILESEPTLPLTTSTLAARIHLSARSLQRGFQRHLDTTPMSYLRDVRLQRAREDLLAGSPDETTVAFIAAFWGFSHLGRFAATYRDRFAEAPSETLRR